MVSTRTASPRALRHGDLQAWTDAYDDLHLDLGTGDGRYALHLAQRHPGMAILGVDTCLDNLAKAARKPPPNLRFVTADATAMPKWLLGRATSVSINFPFGSLFRAVVDDAGALMEVAAPGALIDIRVNASAGAEYGIPFEVVHERITRALSRIAPHSARVRVAPQAEMRDYPTTWAKRLAYGRPSQVIVATAQMAM